MNNTEELGGAAIVRISSISAQNGAFFVTTLGMAL